MIAYRSSANGVPWSANNLAGEWYVPFVTDTYYSMKTARSTPIIAVKRLLSAIERGKSEKVKE